MKVEEIMTEDVKSCLADDNLATVVRRMWEGDCGLIPVVDTDRRVAGVVTDRDICIALATRDRTASALLAGDVLSQAVYTCSPGDDVKAALETMRMRRVRRLPVVDGQNQLVGILSMSDIVLHSDHGTGRKTGGISYADVAETFKGICQRTRQAVRKTLAAGMGRAP